MRILGIVVKGIVLAGGSGSRLHPITKAVNKHLLPIYDKPMIYYPISTLMLAGIKDIMLITTPDDVDSYKRLLGDGSDFGISIEYAIQDRPAGIAQALIIAENFVKDGPCALILGDNVFFGHGLVSMLKEAAKITGGALIFAYPVRNPSDFGVVEFDINGKALSLEEKPKEPRSRFAVPGLYFYDRSAAKKAKRVKPSWRGELEITDVNQQYLDEGNLKVIQWGRGMAWLDMGTFEGLTQASTFIESVEKRQGMQVACLEEIAYHNGWISREKVEEKAKALSKNDYGRYLLSLTREHQ